MKPQVGFLCGRQAGRLFRHQQVFSERLYGDDARFAGRQAGRPVSYSIPASSASSEATFRNQKILRVLRNVSRPEYNVGDICSICWTCANLALKFIQLDVACCFHPRDSVVSTFCCRSIGWTDPRIPSDKRNSYRIFCESRSHFIVHVSLGVRRKEHEEMCKKSSHGQLGYAASV